MYLSWVHQGLGQLDLYHATIIMHQLSFLGLSTLASGSYRDTMKRVFVYWLSSLFTSIVFAIWSLYIWIYATNLGGGQSCNNSMIYVIFFVNARTTAPWLRWSFVGVAALAVLLSVGAACMAAYVLWNGTRIQFELPLKRFFHGNGPITEDPDSIPSGDLENQPHDPAPPTSGSRQFTTKAGVIIEAPTLLRTLTYANGKGVVTDGVDVGTMWPEESTSSSTQLTLTQNQRSYIFIRLLTLIYGTVMLELTIKRNHVQPGESSWGFGQIVAVVIAAGGLNEVLHFVLGEEWENMTEEDERNNSMYISCRLIPDPPLMLFDLDVARKRSKENKKVLEIVEDNAGRAS